MSITDARVSTGIAGLDRMMGGGYPKESIVMISEGPGSGMTISSLQYTIAAVGRARSQTTFFYRKYFHPEKQS